MGQESASARVTELEEVAETIPPGFELDVLRAHPKCPAAMRAHAESMVRLHSRSRMAGWFLSDRTLAILAHAAEDHRNGPDAGVGGRTKQPVGAGVEDIARDLHRRQLLEDELTHV